MRDLVQLAAAVCQTPNLVAALAAAWLRLPVRAPYTLVSQLTRMRRYGVLSRYIPEFGRVIGQIDGRGTTSAVSSL